MSQIEAYICGYDFRLIFGTIIWFKYDFWPLELKKSTFLSPATLHVHACSHACLQMYIFSFQNELISDNQENSPWTGKILNMLSRGVSLIITFE